MLAYKRFIKFFVAATYLITGGITLLFSRKNLKPVYRGFRYFMEHKSARITLDCLRSDPEFRARIQERYREFDPVPWAYLASLPAGTLGYEFAKFMNNVDVTPLEKLPEASEQIDPEIDYLRARIRLTHDIHHVLCGHPATEIGEMAISAFYVAQINSPLNSLLLAVGLVKCTLTCPERLKELLTVISEGFHQGLQAKNVFGGKWEEMWERPVSEIRQEWNIKPSFMDFVPAPHSVPHPIPHSTEVNHAS